MSDLNNLEIAAQVWCDEETSSITMDSRLAVAFAKRLDAKDARIQELEKQLAESTNLHREGLEPFDANTQDDYNHRVCSQIKKSLKLLEPPQDKES